MTSGGRDAVPLKRDVEGRVVPNEQAGIGPLNRIASAKAKLAEYKRVLGPSKGEMRMRIDDIEAFRLSQKEPIDSDRLKRIKATIDAAAGGALLQTAGKASSGGVLGTSSSVFDDLLTAP